jgi:hypothetical protein
MQPVSLLSIKVTGQLIDHQNPVPTNSTTQTGIHVAKYPDEIGNFYRPVLSCAPAV